MGFGLLDWVSATRLGLRFDVLGASAARVLLDGDTILTALDIGAVACKNTTLMSYFCEVGVWLS